MIPCKEYEYRHMFDRHLYVDQTPIFKKTTDLDYIIQPRAMVKRGSMCTTELMSKSKYSNHIFNKF